MPDLLKRYPSDKELLTFIDHLEKNELYKAPANFKDSVLRETNTFPVQAEVKKKELSKNMQLLFYSLKVCTAIVWVFLLLNLSSFARNLSPERVPVREMNEPGISSVISEKTEDMGSTIRNVTNEITSFRISDLKIEK